MLVCSELEDSPNAYKSEASEVRDTLSDSQDALNNLKVFKKRVYYREGGTERK